MPDFCAYLNKSLLPQMPYWSNILLEKPSTIQANTKNKHNLLVINNAKINNKTNAVIENLFKHKKADTSTLNEPIIDYIKVNIPNIPSKCRFEEALFERTIENRQC